MIYGKYMNVDEYNRLIKNGQDYSEDKDDFPVIRLFMTNTACTWLLTELDPESPDNGFGLCDLGMGSPELGYVSLTEIIEAEAPFLTLQRDFDFKAEYPISVYAAAARNAQEIVINPISLQQAASKLQP